MSVTRPSARTSRRARGLVPAIVLALVAVLGVTVVPAGALTGADYFVGNAAQESFLSEMAISPTAIRIGSKTVVAYQGTGYATFVTSYDESTRQWDGPYLVGTNPLRLDAHGAPTIYLDDNRFVHVIYGSHSTPMLHAVSTSPETISSWVQEPPVVSQGTYPQPVHLDTGETLLFYREGSNDFFGWGMRRSMDGGSNFDDGYLTVLAGWGGASTGWYAHFAAGKNGVVHCAFTRRDDAAATNSIYSRRNLYYIWRDPDDGIWYNAQGKSVRLPVTLASADLECKVYDSGNNAVNEVVLKEEPTATPAPGSVHASVTTTKTPGRALISFNVGTGRGVGAYTWKMARSNGTTTGPAFSFYDITTTDHTFDSATFQPEASGTIDAYLVTGGSDALLTSGNQMDGRGGRIERWKSDDHGEKWSFVETVSPTTEPGEIFGDPQIVQSPSDAATVVFTEWDNDPWNFYHRLYLWGKGGKLVKRDYTPVLDRVAGDTRFTTAIEISKAAYPSGADTVLLATAWNYPDALAAAPLSAALRAPILLLPKAGLPDNVAAEIKRLKATNAVLLGSTSVVPTDVPTLLKEKTTVTKTERLAGADRYGTALAVAARLQTALGRPLGKAIVASGKNYPDALAAGPVAARLGYPIVLAPATDTVPPNLTSALTALGVSSTIVVGGPPAVSTTFTAGLPAPIRLAGLDRYETAAAIARYGLANGLTPLRIMLASGRNFPDALAGSALGAQARAGLLLTDPNTLSLPASAVLSEVATGNVQAWLLGGPPAVSNTVRDGAASRLGATIGKP